MEEKHVRNAFEIAGRSLLMGILAILTSFPCLFVSFFGLAGAFGDSTLGAYVFWSERGGWNFTQLISLGFGVAGIILGRQSLKLRPWENGKAVAGVVLGSLAILFVIATSYAAIAVMGWNRY